MPRPAGYATLDVALAIGLGVTLSLIAYNGLSAYHGWGDDFAGYWLQAKALATGRLHEELALNHSVLAQSDGQLGPNGYPWGYPLLLFLLASIGQESLNAFKVLAVAGIGVAGVFAYLLARQFFDWPLALLAAGAATIQTHILRSADVLMSDIPFLGVSIPALYLMVRTGRLLEAGRPAVRHALGAAVLTVAAFAIRSQGAFLGPAFVAAGGYLWFTSTGEARKRVFAAGAAYCSLVAVLLAVLFVTLPDGSMSHASYLHFRDIPQFIRRARECFQAAALLQPFSLMTRLGEAGEIALVVTVLLMVAGAVRHWRATIVFIGYVALLSLLLLTFPYNQGARYLYPLMLPGIIFMLLAVQDLLNRLKGRWPALDPAGLAMGAAAVAAVVLFVAVTVPAVLRPRAYVTSGPYAPPAQALWTWMRDLPADARISFFKPRAVRLLTGRAAVRVGVPEHASRADYFVIDKATDYDTVEQNRQLPRSYFADSTAFEPVFDNSQFTVFHRRVPVPR